MDRRLDMVNHPMLIPAEALDSALNKVPEYTRVTLYEKLIAALWVLG